MLVAKNGRVSTSHNGMKRVRVWHANLLGIEVKVTEVDTHCMIGRPKIGGGLYEDDYSMGKDYHIENIEWEFKVRVDKPSGIMISDDEQADKSAVTKIGPYEVRIHRAWFEGDEEDYRRDMSMIRLLDLREAA